MSTSFDTFNRHFQPVNSTRQHKTPGPSIRAALCFQQITSPQPLTPFWHVGCLRVIRWRYKAMTPQISQAADKHIESELHRLAYSAYLFTLDPGLAVSVVMTAIHRSLEGITTGPDLLERNVEL